MKFKIKSYLLVFILPVFFLYSAPVSASQCAGTYLTNGTVPLAQCGQTGGNNQDCSLVGGWFYSGACTPTATIQASATTCFSQGRNFDGVSGCLNSCRTGGQVLCGNTCQAPATPSTCPAGYAYNQCGSPSCSQSACQGYQYRDPSDGLCKNWDIRMTAAEEAIELIFDILSGLTGQSLCLDDSMCAANQSCNNYLCSGTGAAGSVCDANTDCGAGLLCGAGGTCQDPFPSNPTCTSSANCPAGDMCFLNNCFPTDAPEGTTCTDTGDCNYSLTCENNVCTAPGISAGSGRFVGLSAAGYTSAITNYQQLNDLCKLPAAYAGSHVCSADEIIASYNEADPVVLAQTTGIGIINNGPPGYVVYANDCNGWSVKAPSLNGADAYGAIWQFASKKSVLASCGSMDPWGGIYDNPNVKVVCCE